MSLFALAAIFSLQANPTVTVEINAPTARVAKSLFGIFFEEINNAGEGGLYAELLNNRGMLPSGSGLPEGWAAAPESVKFDANVKLNGATAGSLHITADGITTAVENSGFWGIPTVRGDALNGRFWVKGKGYVRFELRDEAGSTLARSTPLIVPDDWKELKVTLNPARTQSKATLRIVAEPGADFYLGYTSLMPRRTYRSRPNGLRSDLAQRLEKLAPGFLRFPGGCYVEGNTLANAFDWRSTLKPIQERPGEKRTFWGYPSSNGLGYHEYLQLCEDLGAEPMFVVNAGLSHSDMTPLDRMSDRVKDALDAIEYANGATSTPMGAMRAANGHPAPFNLKYIEIGNENGYSWSFGGLPAYAERFDLINKGIKSKYPKIITISNVEVPNPGDYVSEHYYDTPNWFWNNKDRYDAYPRKGPKIYIGEYAVTRQNGRGALVGALSEAAFMTGMERNADIVAMGSYAPLFENVNRRQWNPNAIVFDSNRSYGTPSYWVQQLFGSHRIEIALTAKAQGPAVPAPPTEGRFGFKTWDTKAEFKDIKITVNGRVAYDVPAPSRDDLASTRGNWTIANGTMTQEALQTDRSVVLLPVAVKSSDDWTFEFSARTIEGKEGFIGLFGVTEDRFGHWNLGGWGNTQHGFERDGSRSGNGVNGKIETGKWYRVAISKKGAVISGQLDGKELATFREQPGSSRIAASLGLDGSRNELILKVVNGYATPQFVRLQGLPAAISDSWSGMKLTGPSATAENSLDDPTSVSPEPISVPAGNQIRVDANSLTILRIPVSALTVTQIKEAMNRKK